MLPPAAALLDGGTRRQLNAETRVSLAVAAGFEGAHYLQAAKIRTRFDTHFRRVLGMPRTLGTLGMLWRGRQMDPV